MKSIIESNTLLDHLEADIRNGQAKLVCQKLWDLQADKFPRQHLARLARISVRAGAARFAVKILSPVVKEHRSSRPQCSNEELAVYALSLMELGVYSEALRILESLDSRALPEVDFYYAVTLFKLWNYRDAIPALQRYIAAESTTPYQKLVGNVNLSAAYINEWNFDSARTLLAGVRQEAQRDGHRLILGNALELSSHLAIFDRQFTEARSYLVQAQSVLREAKGVYSMFVDKWHTIADLLEFGATDEQLHRLDIVRGQAQELKHWSSMRECDFFRALATGDQDLLKLVYVGTPYQGYRARMLKLFGESQMDLGETYLWCPKGNPVSKKLVFDVELGKDIKTGARLKDHQVPHRLLHILTSDFYVPFKAGELFSRLFENENFNPETSVARVYNGISTLKGWIEKNKLPFKISNTDSGYQLIVMRPYVLKVSTQPQHEAGSRKKPPKFSHVEIPQSFRLLFRAISLVSSPPNLQ